MNRNGLKKMTDEIERSRISTVMVKDLSRLGRDLGRDYVGVGQYLNFLAENDVRFIAVSDNIDTDDGKMEMVMLAIKNVLNECYAADISKKVRTVKKMQGNLGVPLSPPPYGYKRNPDNPKSWVIDDEAAAVVRKIFDLTLNGRGIEEIAAQLEREKVLTPMGYLRDKGLKKGGKLPANPYSWGHSTVYKILGLHEYCGDVINFKTYSKSYKNKTRHENEPENMAVFKDVHEPIIHRDIFENVQKKRENKRKRPSSTGEKNMFSGLLYCEECGSVLNYHTNTGNRSIEYFNCYGYNCKRGYCTKTHYIRLDFLKQIALSEIQRMTKFAVKHEQEFVRLVAGKCSDSMKCELDLKKRELANLRRRESDLDNILGRLYEDNLNGKITDERYAKMFGNYENEQSDIISRIKVMTLEIEKVTEQQMTAETFIDTVRKYTRAKSLSERMLNELIQKIVVYQAEKADGVYVQKLEIHWNCTGLIELPEETIERLPKVDVVTNPRQGVYVEYHA